MPPRQAAKSSVSSGSHAPARTLRPETPAIAGRSQIGVRSPPAAGTLQSRSPIWTASWEPSGDQKVVRSSPSLATSRGSRSSRSRTQSWITPVPLPPSVQGAVPRPSLLRVVQESRLPSGDRSMPVSPLAGIENSVACEENRAGVDDGFAHRPATSAAIATAPNSVAAKIGSETPRPRVVACAGGPSTSPPAIASSSIRASPMSRSRRFGSRSRQRARSFRSRSGVAAGSAPRSGSRIITRPSVSCSVSPANICWPTSISQTTTPNDQMSARLSTVFPFACSGDM